MRDFSAILLAGLLASCAAPRPEPALPQSYYGQARPATSPTDTVLAATHAYWAEIAAGRWRAAYGFFTHDYKEDHSFAQWQRLRHDAWSAPPRPVAIRWTKGTHRFEGPELYAIVAWTARKGSAGSDGTLVWRQEEDGTFLLENTDPRVFLVPRS